LPFPADAMVAAPVSRRVNSVRNDGGGLLVPDADALVAA
jgi:hypothetical protein